MKKGEGDASSQPVDGIRGIGSDASLQVKMQASSHTYINTMQGWGVGVGVGVVIFRDDNDTDLKITVNSFIKK